ncbi:MAG: hypothetical protein IPL65_03475 [Lewinellaceae bacterium]|nr:hypothetical protein [Lewinellaceae bacterium]
MFALLAGFLFSLIMPWWCLVLVGVLAGLIWPYPGHVFVAALLAGTVLWSGVAFWADLSNLGIMSARIGQLFKGASSAGLIGITGILGGLLTGMGSLCGAYAMRAMGKND